MKRLIVILIILGCGFQMGMRSVSAQRDPESKELLAQLKKAVQEMQTLAQPRPVYESAAITDPMSPLIDAKGNLLKMPETQEGMLVQGVLWSHDFKTVLINDKTYAVGDRIGSERIDEICSNGFFLENGETRARRFVSLYDAATFKEENSKAEA